MNKYFNNIIDQVVLSHVGCLWITSAIMITLLPVTRCMQTIKRWLCFELKPEYVSWNNATASCKSWTGVKLWSIFLSHKVNLLQPEHG